MVIEVITLNLNVNIYNTVWGNRFISRGYDFADGSEGTVNFSGIESVHQGVGSRNNLLC